MLVWIQNILSCKLVAYQDKQNQPALLFSNRKKTDGIMLFFKGISAKWNPKSLAGILIHVFDSISIEDNRYAKCAVWQTSKQTKKWLHGTRGEGKQRA